MKIYMVEPSTADNYSTEKLRSSVDSLCKLIQASGLRMEYYYFAAPFIFLTDLIEKYLVTYTVYRTYFFLK